MQTAPILHPFRRAHFEVLPINQQGYAINEGGRTVALISKHGYVDWLLKTPTEPGNSISSILKETHLSYILGFKFNLFIPYLADESGRAGTKPTSIEFHTGENGESLTISCIGWRADRRFKSLTEAVIELSDDGLRYEWHFRTSMTHYSDEPHQLTNIEYNNLCPGRAYRGLLHRERKQYTHILCEEETGEVIAFPHQHAYHYGKKFQTLRFGESSWAGYFGEEDETPVVITAKGSVPLHWEICDMYYDLHCCVRAPYTFQPGETLELSYTIRYLNEEESDRLGNNSTPIAFTEDELTANPRAAITTGVNRFEEAIRLNQVDDRCFFRPSKQCRWIRHENGTNSLEISSAGDPHEWSSEPPFHAINGTTLKVSGKVRTSKIVGKGCCLRLQYYHYVWGSPSGFEPLITLESEWVANTTDQQSLTIPPLEIPASPVEDGMLRIKFVIEGCGTAWLDELSIEPC